ncbi:MAG: hypothetical protein JWR10_4102 [Rubritepida sp.]|nr:hypothetical protein [Rubritepida sp.]
MPSADILPFPQKPEDRLRAALRSLEAALDDQKSAFDEFRSNLVDLGGAVSGLETSVQEYRGTLAKTAQDLQLAGSQARRLEATADIWLNDAR